METASTPLPGTDLLLAAVRLAIENAEQGQAPFGALVVSGGEVLGTGVNTVERDDDPTAHAEVAALRAAARSHGAERLVGAIVVSSCEPCAMCHAACAVAGVTHIVYAASKELVPDIASVPELLSRMQAALRAVAPASLVHVPTPGAEVPFARTAPRPGRPGPG